MIAACTKIQIASDLHLEIHHDRYPSLFINDRRSLVEAIGAQPRINCPSTNGTLP